jgi:hypothetical protein
VTREIVWTTTPFLVSDPCCVHPGLKARTASRKSLCLGDMNKPDIEISIDERIRRFRAHDRFMAPNMATTINLLTSPLHLSRSGGVGRHQCRTRSPFSAGQLGRVAHRSYNLIRVGHCEAFHITACVGSQGSMASGPVLLLCLTGPSVPALACSFPHFSAWPSQKANLGLMVAQRLSSGIPQTGMLQPGDRSSGHLCVIRSARSAMSQPRRTPGRLVAGI